MCHVSRVIVVAKGLKQNQFTEVVTNLIISGSWNAKSCAVTFTFSYCYVYHQGLTHCGCERLIKDLNKLSLRFFPQDDAA